MFLVNKKNTQMKKTILFSAIAAIALLSCTKEEAEEPADVTPEPTPISFKFAADVQPIFVANCGTGGSCHGTGSASDGKIYETHAGASAVPGTTTVGAIKHSNGFSNMPRSAAKMSDDKIAIIEAWVNGGMLND